MVKVRRPFDRVGYPMEEFSASRTKQSFVGEADVNNIMKRYRATGLMRQVGGTPLYLDCTKLPSDYQDSLNKVVAANQAFERLSSDVRYFFNNDPSAFVEFASDPANLEQMREWNLAPPAPGPRAATLDDVVAAVKEPKAGVQPSKKEGTA